MGSAPDDRLLELAKTNALADSAARRAEATRLLADPRARDQVHRFHAMWLGYRALPGSADLLAAFNTETTALIDKIVFDQPASYLTLFSSGETYVNNLLADQYGLPRPPGGAGWVAYGDERARRHPLARRRPRRVQQVLGHQPDPARNLRADAPAL